MSRRAGGLLRPSNLDVDLLLPAMKNRTYTISERPSTNPAHPPTAGGMSARCFSWCVSSLGSAGRSELGGPVPHSQVTTPDFRCS